VTTLKLGYTNPLNDTFGAHPNFGGPLDLNDGQTFVLVSPDGLELPPPPRTLVPAGNIRTQGERVMRSVYRRNREVVARLILGPGSSYSSLVPSVRSLVAWLSGPPLLPLTIQFQQTGAAAPVYLDVVGCAHDIPEDESQWLRLQFEPIELVFICRPGMRGDRVTLQNLVNNPGFDQGSGPAVVVFNDSLANSDAYSAGSVASSILTLTTGQTAAFGSPAWGAINQWQVRFQWATGLTGTFYLHRVDANNSLYVSVTTGTFALYHQVAGTAHLLATGNTTLVNGTWYWVQVTQFPSVSGDPPYLTAKLLNDSAGAPGTQVVNGLQSAAAYDGVTALVGRPAIGASGGTLNVGGAFSSVQQLALFGPGAWQFVSTGAGVCSGAWDGDQERGASGSAGVTYTGGPVSSLCAARIDLPPTGAVNAQWASYGGGAPAGTSAMPVTALDVLGVSAAVESSGLAATATVSLIVIEYDSNGNYLRQGTVQSKAGNLTNGAWLVLSGTYTTGASCAYVAAVLNVTDGTSGSANGILWCDNAQAWDQTSTGASSMPYCELRFHQSPAQLVVSGLLGDLPAAALLSWGTFLSSWAKGGTLNYAIGRRARVSAGALLVAPSIGFFGTAFTPQATAVLDSAGYGGYYVKATVGTGGWNPRAFSPKVADVLGVYHVVQRYQTHDISPTGVQVRAKTEEALDPWYTDVNTLKTLGTYYGPYQYPLSAGSVWTVSDAGQVAIPPFARGALRDDTLIYEIPRGEWVGTTAGGAEGDASWCCLLPVDGSLVLGVVNNPSNSPVAAVTNQYLWCYIDGLLTNRAGAYDGPGWTYSIEALAVPNPGHGGGGAGTQNTGAINVNSGGDPYLVLDPTLQLSGQSGGINQMVAYVSDQAGAVLPFYGELQYSPLYLYPR
jgi:hypothetical protein